MKRRNFLKMSAGGAAALGLASCWAAGGGAGGGQRPGLALYTVMGPLREDFEGTLRQVADIGYREVETIGTMGRDPAELRDLLGTYGLQARSQHMTPGGLYDVFDRIVKKEITLEQLTEAYLEQFNRAQTERIMAESIEYALALGQTYVVWPIVFKQQLSTRAKVLELCDAFNVAGKMCADAGLVFCFHNHAEEFVPVNGEIPYDIFLDETDPETVKFQMDMFWVSYAGVDPYHYLSNYPDRYRQAHIKDMTADRVGTDVGTGIVDFGRFLPAARVAGVEKWYVEQDKPADALASARAGYNHLMSL